MSDYISNLARRIQITPGQVRKPRPRVWYLSPDRRALLVDIDSASKYPSVGGFVDTPTQNSAKIVVMMGADDRTLRHDNRYRRHTQIEIPLPKVATGSERWIVEISPTKWGALVYAICPQNIPAKTRKT